ncbi:MAG: hypothetical protein UHY58_01810 [Alistipes sp.]|nr:hypothetical protein [Alistipes sp.]
MNKKTFTVAVIFMIVTVAWLAFELYFYFAGYIKRQELVLPVVFVIAAVIMCWREFIRKKRKHVEDVKRYL